MSEYQADNSILQIESPQPRTPNIHNQRRNHNHVSDTTPLMDFPFKKLKK